MDILQSSPLKPCRIKTYVLFEPEVVLSKSIDNKEGGTYVMSRFADLSGSNGLNCKPYVDFKP